VAGASPKLFGLDNFTELTTNLNLAEVFDGVAYARWKSFRESEASRYVALTLPRVLARLPYGEKLKRTEAFKFEEFADGENNDKFLWMSAAWTYAARVTDAFAKYGWMQRTRGAHGGGKAEGLPVHTFPTDDGDIATKCPTEIAISDRRDFELSHVGFLPLLYNNDAEIACFVGASSCNKPQRYFDKAANACAERSAEFNLTLCRSRFVHYLKVMARDKIGSFLHVEHCGRWLTEWLADYRVDRNVESAFKPWDARADEASEAMLTQRPLAEGRVEVRQGAKTGCCEMVIWLGIHFGFRDYEPPIQLVAEIPKLRG